MNKSVLIIGFPGAVAKQVARMLARAGTPTTLLVTAGDMRHARALRKSTGESLHLITGSPDHIDFGLSGETYMELAANTRVVLSLLPQVMGRTEAPPGTLTRIGKELVEFALTAGPQTRVLHLSSIDIRGTGAGLFAESDIDIGQKPLLSIAQERLRNERVLGRFRSRFPITIVRTGVITGTGPGLVPLVPLMLAEPAFFSRYDEGGLNLTPLAGLSALIIHLLQFPEDTAGRTLHFFADSERSPRHLSASLTALAREMLPADADPVAMARPLCESAGFTARAFWQHNGSISGVSTAWTKTFFASRGFSSEEHLHVDWAQLMSETVNDLLAVKEQKGDAS
jgi:hypothetical protein